MPCDVGCLRGGLRSSSDDSCLTRLGGLTSGESCLVLARGGLRSGEGACCDRTLGGLKSGESCLARLGGLISGESCLCFVGGARSGGISESATWCLPFRFKLCPFLPPVATGLVLSAGEVSGESCLPLLPRGGLRSGDGSLAALPLPFRGGLKSGVSPLSPSLPGCGELCCWPNGCHLMTVSSFIWGVTKNMSILITY